MTDRARCDLLITNGFVISMNPERQIFSAGAVAIDNGRIAAVGRAVDLESYYAPDKLIDAKGAPVHPGLIDAHVHLIHTARGAFPDSVDFETGMNLYSDWWDGQTEDEEYDSSLLGVVELARNGVTCFVEGGTALEPDVAARAVEAVGIRASLPDPFLWDRGVGLSPSKSMSRAPVGLDHALGKLGGQLWRNHAEDALVRGHIAVYGMGYASLELQLAAKAHARDNGVLYAQHQSFAAGDVEHLVQELNGRPMLKMAEAGLLDSDSMFVHMNYLDDDELAVVRDSGMGIAWCVASSMVWGVGGTSHGRHPELFHAGVPVALGSDSCNSSCRFDTGLQALLGVLSARERTLSREILSAEDALEMMTIGGARCIGRDAEIGSLEVGKYADLVIRTLDVAEARPGLDPLQSIVFAAGSASVDTVIVAGEVVVQGRRTIKVDDLEVYAKATQSSHQIMKRLGISAIEQVWPVVS